MCLDPDHPACRLDPHRIHYDGTLADLGFFLQGVTLGTRASIEGVWAYEKVNNLSHTHNNNMK